MMKSTGSKDRALGNSYLNIFIFRFEGLFKSKLTSYLRVGFSYIIQLVFSTKTEWFLQ